MLIYVAGPYGADTEYIPLEELDAYLASPEAQADIEANVQHAMEVAAKLWDAGHAVICPHANTHMVSKLTESMTHERWLAGDFQMVQVCDAIYMLRGWQDSRGALAEFECATRNRLLTYFEDGRQP